ncbi:glycosyl transferase family 2 [Oscillochloris trichoides DG-6]|uniref:Glycosyl transferase family 2 n=1 Tax=Oscillochloris trichoides DG-6 TaxID=765420 RepID=E1IFA7_9CHLR|nr:glycosyltransferase [Oscillochloris trichoides]EFO80147.1 glycosyl transferase family 2 [Oscillochloris trichoides DG-6]
MRISLICTVRDEADNIATLLDSILAQTRLPDEIVVNDCGSRDATAMIVREYASREPRIRLVQGGHNISSGRNSAISHARGDLIACTDAGLRLDPGWLAAIIAPLEGNRADLVAGFFTPDPQSLFELTLGAVNYRNVEEIDPATFLPFGKSMAFRRELWATVGGFPEWASHCEDLIFARAAERAGYRRTFAPTAIVHFRPRESLRAFARQYFLYARGDGVAGLWTTRHIIRYATYKGLLILLWALWRWPSLRPLGMLLLALGAGGYTYKPYRRLWPRLRGRRPTERLIALLLVPIIRVVGDAAKMIGYPVGIGRRI